MRCALSVNDNDLSKGDGVVIEGEGELLLNKGANAEILFFDLAPNWQTGGRCIFHRPLDRLSHFAVLAEGFRSIS